MLSRVGYSPLVLGLFKNEPSNGEVSMIKVVCWNIGRTHKPLEELLEMDADVALLQEVHPGGYEWLRTAKDGVAVSPQEPWELWDCYDRWPLVVKLSDRVQVEWFKQTIPTRWVETDEIAVSGVGTIAAAKVSSMDGGEPFIAASMYARWYEPKANGRNRLVLFRCLNASHNHRSDGIHQLSSVQRI